MYHWKIQDSTNMFKNASNQLKPHNLHLIYKPMHKLLKSYSKIETLSKSNFRQKVFA